MMKFAFAVVLVLAVAGAASGALEKRVLGSRDCGKDRQYHVQIQAVQGGRPCGGSLLNPRWVITAAHCAGQVVKLTLGSNNDVSFFKKLGSFLKGSSKKYTQEIQTSQQFAYTDDDGNAHDIMLIKLNEGMSGSLPAIKLPSPDCTKPAAGLQVQIGGWGPKDAGVKAKASSSLRCANTKIVDCGENDKPGGAYFSDEDSIMCGFQAGVEACNGDSGSAVEYEAALHGIIVSNPVDKCAGTIVMANVCHYMEWIEKTMKENS